MALQIVSGGIRCHSCRQRLLRSFIASLGDQAAIRSRPSFHQNRAFAQAPALRNQPSNSAQSRDALSLNGLNSALPPQRPSETHQNEETLEISELQSPQSEQPKETDYIPWYLQSEHQPSTPSPSPAASRQQIPELPSHPPELLQPLLQHVSVDLGMDDLALLDLRALDPPPALGANLLMIIGTARSERHLHVSADRLCRLLRSTYHLNPYADGLLGRNEIKIQMRRRLKRSRLMSAVGAKATAETDLEAGLRTGWVCVNIGRVEGGDLPEDEKKVQRMESRVGFGARFEGCNIVVQMLTEEKRREVDLEKLWEGIITRARREDAKAHAETGGMETQDELHQLELDLDDRVGVLDETGTGSEQKELRT